MKKAQKIIKTSFHFGALLMVILLSTGCSVFFQQGKVLNPSVPEPAKSVDLQRYLGRWYEIARYEAPFQYDCEAVTADYSQRPDGRILVLNSCKRKGPQGPTDSAEGHAIVQNGSGNAKLRVSFFWPFYGDYWVLDRGEAYEWAIVGEPSGRYLWLLFRDPHPPEDIVQSVKTRAAQMGYRGQCQLHILAGRIYAARHIQYGVAG